MKFKVGINGFGRIGRIALRHFLEESSFDVVAINDLSPVETSAYLLKYDSLHGQLDKNISNDSNHIIIDGKNIEYFSEPNPDKIGWKDLDLVIESTGRFTNIEYGSKHLQSGAKCVIISAPAKDTPTFVFGVNHELIDKSMDVICAASCTTNCLAATLKPLMDMNISSGYMSTIHAYTNNQPSQDFANHGDMRRSRAAASNIIPTTTGAASSIGKVIPELEGKMDGMAFRVPLSIGSVIDLTLCFGEEYSKEDILQRIKNYSANRLSGVLQYIDDPIVSSDIVGNRHGAIFDSSLLKVMKDGDRSIGHLVSWYDNETGYVSQLVKLAKYYIEKKRG